jgi:hypothetical protein
MRLLFSVSQVPGQRWWKEREIDAFHQWRREKTTSSLISSLSPAHPPASAHRMSSTAPISIKKPRRTSSWSFCLRDDDDEEDSDAEPPPPPPPPPRLLAAEEVLLAEAEADRVPSEEEEREVFDIGQVEEGDIKFVETPFTIARRFAGMRKRALEDEGVEDNQVCGRS